MATYKDNKSNCYKERRFFKTFVVYRLDCWVQLPSRPVGNQFWQDLIQIRCFKFYRNHSTLNIVVFNSKENTSAYIVVADLRIFMSWNCRCYIIIYSCTHVGMAKELSVIPFIYVRLLEPAVFFLQSRVLTLFSSYKLSLRDMFKFLIKFVALAIIKYFYNYLFFNRRKNDSTRRFRNEVSWKP